MADNVIIGVNILETLTTGMYRDPLVIYREYLQNSCDAIDDAVKCGLYEHANQAQVDIYIEDNNITILDDGVGVPAKKFKQTLYSIGESQKTAGINKGFRGIGHWCGFAHCETLVFTAKSAGESVESVMKCDAAKMRAMMLDHRVKKKTYTIDDVLSSTTKFSTHKADDSESHYFKVEMFNVVESKDELCSLQYVKDYLSFIIPVGYATAFRFRTEIHKHAEDIGQTIQEYSVSINGEIILKEYKPSFMTHGKGEDEITSVEFKDFWDDEGMLIAWMWFGTSNFKGQMVSSNKMRGIRLRSQNIQIGGDDALQRLFRESNGRGLYYYIGEVFALSNELLPDSQRDYFEPGEMRIKFESLLHNFFNDELTKIYYTGSRVNAAFDKIEKAEQISKEIENQASVSDEKREQLRRAQDEAKKAKIELAKIIQKSENKQGESDAGVVNTVVSEIIKKKESKHGSGLSQSSSLKSDDTGEKAEKRAAATPVVVTVVRETPSDKLISFNSVCGIVRAMSDSSTADAIIAKIEEELT